ncbi:MAG: CBS domain-containing protein [Chitinophagales bacterium]|nr:CBS domain-containing protein [Bacteroidota bacterium]MBK9556327.1 CBS domain-containing protein [Bacteroidota bacterium]MBL0280830.1 CBS domain-containing protein [Bacteroidota bacterium]MBP8250612.1 CBS domain-containing protein [Chitinophagales bacterium]MBP9879301.1 CBS domain-containing protein [Chitinophagales bacterium]
MLAKDIISENIPPLKIKDTGAKAIEWMYEFKLSHLPLVDHQNYIGLVSEEDILDFNDTHEQLGKFLKNLYKPFVKETEHIYEVLRVAANLKTTVIPVVDSEQHYIGLITLQSLLYNFAKMSSISEPGGVIIIELNNKTDYVLSDIARIVEGNDAHILSLYFNVEPDSGKHAVTIKVDSTEIKHIVATFERYQYQVKAYFQESDMVEIIKDRYDSLMNYLNI